MTATALRRSHFTHGVPSPATFPSRLRASGRKIVDENSYTLPLIKGFNAQVPPWSQSDFDRMAQVGGKFIRHVLFWDQWQPTATGGIRTGQTYATGIPTIDNHGIDASFIDSAGWDYVGGTTGLDVQIARAEAAGHYSMFDIQLNLGRDPAWAAAAADETSMFMANGQAWVQFLANRYGNPASPQYTKSVVGLGLNEPPVNGTTLNGNNAIPYIEAYYRTLIGWFRTYAPDWIGFVGYAYGQATPIFDHTFQNVLATDADPHAYDSVGGNVIIDLHDYMLQVVTAGTSTPNTSPTATVYQYNGMTFPESQGGMLVGADATPAPTYTSSSFVIAQMKLLLSSYKTFSINASIPLMIGESGWQDNATGEAAWAVDKAGAWADAGTVIQLEWDYNRDPVLANDPWEAYYTNTRWRTMTTTWMQVGNLLTANQSDIETSAAGWFVISTSCTLAQTTNPTPGAFAGTHALSLTSTGGTILAATSGGNFTAAAGNSYELSAVVQAATAARSVTFGVAWFDSGFTQVGSSSIPAVTDATGGWKGAIGRVTAPAATTSGVVTVTIPGAVGGEVHYLDYVRVLAA